VEWIGLPPGQYRVGVDFLDHTGRVLHASPPRQVQVGGSGLATIVEAYWE
jgi:hypothetical protein